MTAEETEATDEKETQRAETRTNDLYDRNWIRDWAWITASTWHDLVSQLGQANNGSTIRSELAFMFKRENINIKT